MTRSYRRFTVLARLQPVTACMALQDWRAAIVSGLVNADHGTPIRRFRCSEHRRIGCETRNRIGGSAGARQHHGAWWQRRRLALHQRPRQLRRACLLHEVTCRPDRGRASTTPTIKAVQAPWRPAPRTMSRCRASSCRVASPPPARPWFLELIMPASSSATATICRSRNLPVAPSIWGDPRSGRQRRPSGGADRGGLARSRPTPGRTICLRRDRGPPIGTRGAGKVHAVADGRDGDCDIPSPMAAKQDNSGHVVE